MRDGTREGKEKDREGDRWTGREMRRRGDEEVREEEKRRERGAAEVREMARKGDKGERKQGKKMGARNRDKERRGVGWGRREERERELDQPPYLNIHLHLFGLMQRHVAEIHQTCTQTQQEGQKMRFNRSKIVTSLTNYNCSIPSKP